MDCLQRAPDSGWLAGNRDVYFDMAPVGRQGRGSEPRILLQQAAAASERRTARGTKAKASCLNKALSAPPEDKEMNPLLKEIQNTGEALARDGMERRMTV